MVSLPFFQPSLKEIFEFLIKYVIKGEYVKREYKKAKYIFFVDIISKNV